MKWATTRYGTTWHAVVSLEEERARCGVRNLDVDRLEERPRSWERCARCAGLLWDDEVAREKLPLEEEKRA